MPLLLVPGALVAGRAGVARQHAREPPDDPVRPFDETLCRARKPAARPRRSPAPSAAATQTRYGRRSEAASARRVGGNAGDPIRLAAAPVVLPQLRPRVRLSSERASSQSGVARGGRRQHGAGGEVDADPDDVPEPTPACASAAVIVRSSPSSQSAGFCSAQSGGSRSPVPGARSSMTPSAYGSTAVPPPRPVATSTSSARTDSVPKSRPMA